MSNNFMKTAVFLAIAAPVLTTGLQNHWFTMGSAPAPALTAQRGDAQRAAQGNPQFASMTPSAAKPRPSWGVVELSPDQSAQYQTDVEISGSRVHALVDTGAYTVLLKAEDARALNIDPPRSAYTVSSATANGSVQIAPVHLREIRVGSIVVYDVEAAVAPPGAANITLLGMSFLKKLSSFQVADGQFVMKQ